MVPDISLPVSEWVLDFMNRDYCMYLSSLPMVAMMLELLGLRYCITKTIPVVNMGS